MSAFRFFELAAIRLMSSGALNDDQLRLLEDEAQPVEYNYTGCGYFLTVRHPTLPSVQRTLSDPAVVGTSGDIQAGFVVFLGDHELCLECHTWGPVDVPEDFRNRQVVISTPPINVVCLRGAT